MLEGTKITIKSVTPLDPTGKMYRFLIKNGNVEKSFEWETEQGVFGHIVEVVDDLVTEGMLGKETFESFQEVTGLCDANADVLSMYVRCSEVDKKLEELFGDYEKIWNHEEVSV